MTAKDLNDWLKKWELRPVDGAKVLFIQQSKMSEYLNGKRVIPPYYAAHIETFDLLPKSKAQSLIQKRTKTYSR